MSKSRRYQVVAVWILEGRYEADGWLEIRTRDPDLTWWEARCKVVRWNHRELTGSVPIKVRVELVAGAGLAGSAYVDQASQLFRWKRDEAVLKIHGTELAFDFRE
jgi:hypothetical protein